MLNMKNILARGGIEFLAVLLGITISLYIDQTIEESAVVKAERSLLSDLQVSLNQDINYAHGVLEDMRASFDAQEKLIAFPCNDVESLSSNELATLFNNVIRGSVSLFPRYGVYRSLVSNSEMKYIENQELKDKLIDLYDFQFKRYENVDPIITNLYQYGLSKFFVEHFGYYRDKNFQFVETHMVINKDAFCQGTLQKEIMKISSMTGAVHWMLEGIVESMNTVNMLIDEELNK
tara:strand:- start:67 stop:768 length:702 start_codon:yes stop_codon:yes gene_type:complete